MLSDFHKSFMIFVCVCLVLDCKLNLMTKQKFPFLWCFYSVVEETKNAKVNSLDRSLRSQLSNSDFEAIVEDNSIEVNT